MDNRTKVNKNNGEFVKNEFDNALEKGLALAASTKDGICDYNYKTVILGNPHNVVYRYNIFEVNQR